METVIGLYRILIGVSAATLLLGLILLTRGLSKLSNSKRQLYILGVVNLLSMLVFLFEVSINDEPGWKEVVIFLESAIITLNMLIAVFVYKALNNESFSFPEQMKRLFFVTFLSVCVYVSAFLIFGGTKGLLQRQNDSFYFIFSVTTILFLIGSFYPMIKSLLDYKNSNSKQKEFKLLLILNGTNNLVGLYFYLLSFPNKKIALLLNIVSNLLFSYYLSYYFLNVFFEYRNRIQLEKEKGGNPYSWKVLKSKLAYWDEMKDYLEPIYPELIKEISKMELSDLEKTHYVLKRLNIKAKDVANGLNVSLKAVEMSRYRVSKKIKSMN